MYSRCQAVFFFSLRKSLFQIICNKNFMPLFPTLFSNCFVGRMQRKVSLFKLFYVSSNILSLQTTCLNAPVLYSIQLLFHSTIGPLSIRWSPLFIYSCLFWILFRTSCFILYFVYQKIIICIFYFVCHG